MAVDAGGNVFISDTNNHRIRIVNPAGAIATFAGTGVAGYSGDGGAPVLARLSGPAGLAVAASGLYIADRDNHRIRRISGGTITTAAGTGSAGYNGDNHVPTSAKLDSPSGVAIDGTGKLYIADTGNDRIRRVAASGDLVTWAGTGTPGFSGDGGVGTSAAIDAPLGIAFDASNTAYFADRDNHRVRRVSSGGTITTFAGRSHFGGDGGPATAAQLDFPFGVAVDSADNVYIADWGNHRIRKVNGGGIVTTIAGNGSFGNSGDGGPATSAQLSGPIDVAVDGAGNVYIADFTNDRVRKVTPAGTITAFAGTGTAGFSGDGGPATSAQLNSPTGLEVDDAGNVYVADIGNNRVRRITPGGTITTVAGSATAGFCGDGGPATSACLNDPIDVAIDDSGNMFIAEYGGHRVRRVAGGTISTVAGNGTGVFSGDGGPATSAGLPFPTGVDVDAAGNIFIATAFNAGAGRIREVDSGGTISTVAGTGGFGFSGDGGPAILAEMAGPARVALNAAGDFYIADSYNDRIRRVEDLGDLAAPTFIGSTPASPANQNTIFVRGTGDPGTTVELYAEAGCLGSVVASGSDAAFSSPGFSVTVPDDSTTAFSATTTDTFGRVSECSPDPLVYVEDSTGPAVTIDSAPVDPSNDTSPTWTFSTEAGATTECELSGPAGVLSPFAGCISPAVFDLSGQPEGDYTLTVRATDAAGNVGASVTSSFTLDATLPAVPSITDGPADPGNDTTPTWQFTSEAGTTTECELSGPGGFLIGFASCSSPQQYDLSGELDGQYTFRVQARDGAGNVGAPATDTYTLDTTDPADPIIDSSPSSPGSSTAPSWTFTTEPGTSAECELAGVSTFQACTSPAVYDLSGEPDGPYTFSVRAVDAAGNRSGADSDTYTLDTTAPDVTITVSPASPSNGRTPSWEFSTEAGASTECELSDAAGVVIPPAPCTSPVQYDLTGFADGPYTISVRAIDAVGNIGLPDTDTFVLDTAGPDVASPRGRRRNPSDATPTWDFTTEPGATTECELSDGAGVMDPYAPCDASVTYDLSAEADGPYSVSVRATDAAGNVGPPSTAGFTLDRSGPDVDITSSPTSPSTSRSPSWSFTTEAGATAQCQLSGPGGYLSIQSPCTSPVSFDLTGQPDGDYSLSIQATDPAGNPGAPAGAVYTLDTTLPAPPNITSAPTSPGNSLGPSWGFTAEAGAGTQCELTGPGYSSPFAPCTSPESFSLAGESDGVYTFRVRATDQAGNTGPDATSDYTLDTTGPAVSITSEPASPNNSRSPQWDFTTEGGATTECRLSDAGGPIGLWASCSAPATMDLTSLPDGAYTFEVQATDPVGNTGPVEASTPYVLDTAPPAVSITSTPGTPGNDTDPEWSFSSEAGASFECELVGPGYSSPFAQCTSPELSSLAGQSDGDYTFSVRATDEAGNTGPVDSDTYTLDTTPPAAPVITSAPATPGTDRSPSWSFTSEPGTSTECEFVQGKLTIPYTACSSPQTLDLTGAPDGNYTIRVRAVDPAGNAGPETSHTYRLDTVGPNSTITSEPSSPGNARFPTWSFGLEAGASAECELTFGGAPVVPSGACVSPTAFDLTGQPDGSYTFRVRGTDAAGNTGPEATSSYTLDTVGPAVTILQRTLRDHLRLIRRRGPSARSRGRRCPAR